MYTFWKRTSPPAQLITFDAPDREKCTARRTITNTPLQALVLLNDPTYLESARVLAERVMKEADATPQPRAALAFELATARPARNPKLSVLTERLQGADCVRICASPRKPRQPADERRIQVRSRL